MKNLSRHFGNNMTVILRCGILLLILFDCQASKLFLQKSAAAQFLSRIRGIFKGNLEGECCEKTCSKEEVREIFEDNQRTEIFWYHYVLKKNSNLKNILDNAAKTLEEQMKINELRKELTRKKQEINNLKEELLGKLESCIDGK
ncbi:coagulation factor X-like [Chiloscyllium punctatum]|uniref:coagulation factor X-like n=1 Tax=Chiloscyllium punctatum TaxID=137246 RepID=UPI003B64237B